MKKIITLLLLFCVFQVQSQTVKGLQKGKLVGAQFYAENEREKSRIEPIYEELFVFVKTQIGGMYLGDGFVESRLWNDTEYVEFPIDPNDPTLTKVDTFILYQRGYIINKPIIAKKNGKYGIIDEKGNVLVGFEHNTYLASMELIGYQNEIQKPLILLQKGSSYTLYDTKLNIILNESQFPKNFHSLNRKYEALQLMLFGDYLLINEGGILADSSVKVPAKKETVKGKVVVKEKAFSYSVYYYKGGNFNVLNLKTGSLLWPNAKPEVFITTFDKEGNVHFENLNPRNINSIFHYQNSSHKISPANIEFK
ncbi:MAG: hypothetical protein MH472_07365 [Bacteroidia bacterium]|nr:hypothetical protein [Bacteroidia bacterium]